MRHAIEFIMNSSPAQIPADVMQMAKRCFLDTMGVWAAGVKSPTSDAARQFAASSHAGPVPLPFTGETVSKAGYAFAGAASIDSVDAHDGHEHCKGHASVTVLPVLMAELWGHADLSWEDCLSHFIVGHEISIRAALSLHRTASDYHASGAWNSVGSVAMAGRVRKLDAGMLRHALGICEYFAPRAEMMRCIAHPSMLKDASSWGGLTAISALDLAEAGFTGAPAILLEDEGLSDIWQDLGQRWRILESNFKAYPVCRWAHPAIEAVLSVKKAHDIPLDQIDRIRIYSFHEATCLHTRRPRDGDAAQYSLPVSVALALEAGHIYPDHIWPDHFDRPDFWTLVEKIELVEDPEMSALFPSERQAKATISMKSGMILQSDIMGGFGTPDNPLSDDELLSKFHRYVGTNENQMPFDICIDLFQGKDDMSSVDDFMKSL